MSIKDRLRRLEGGARGPGCPECRLKPEVAHVFYPSAKGDPYPEPDSFACPECGRTLGFVIQVVYEGEGAYLDEPLPRN
jgi:hypothetical protein